MVGSGGVGEGEKRVLFMDVWVGVYGWWKKGGEG